MGKYDFSLEIKSQKDPNAIVLSKINRHSTVLEFGPYRGRATKYMKEKLDCKIYAVELDKEAAKDCAEFTEEIIVGDIEKYEWVNKYSGIEFDTIIFIDVLEHLHNPVKVLECAKKLLKYDGSIFMSVPNITHNSILINMINNKFNYTETGILDKTHVHFWGYDNLIEMIYGLDLVPFRQNATYCDMNNEVNTDYANISPILAQELMKRPYGHVYQYVLELKKANFVQDNELAIIKDIRGKEQYRYNVSVELRTLQNGAGDFIEQKKIYDSEKFELNLNDHSVKSVLLTISNYFNRILKVDVVCKCENENKGLIVKELLNTGAPYEIFIPEETTKIIVSISNIDINENVYLKQKETIEKLNEQKNKYEKEIAEKDEMVCKLKKEISEVQEKIEKQRGKIENLQKQVEIEQQKTVWRKMGFGKK